MDIRTFVTDYDENLTGDSFIDPLGVRVIWSSFGELIFKRRVNSISNDVRNYTLNLINHALVRNIVNDESIQLNEAMVSDIGGKHSLAFKQACLLHLENIFTFTMVGAPPESNVDRAGVLGNNNAARFWSEETYDPPLCFSHKDKAPNSILARQLGLGVSGRYKTPFMELQFFDGHYNYHLPQFTSQWSKAEALIRDNPLLSTLLREARNHLLVLIKRYTSNPNLEPVMFYSELPTSLIEAYWDALSSSKRAGQITRKFWLDITGLNTGAAGAMLKVLDIQFEEYHRDYLPAKELFFVSEEFCENELEKQKLIYVETLEPLLAETDLLFTLLRHRRKQSFNEIEDCWINQYGRSDKTLPEAAESIRCVPELCEKVQGTAHARLIRLLSVAESQHSFGAQIEALLSYHRWVMKDRGQLPWVEMSSTEAVTVNARTTSLPDIKEAQPGHYWVNEYYIPQFINLLNGLRGDTP